MRIRSKAMLPLFALAMIAPGLAQAQSTPADMRDLIGARGSSGEQELTRRGYVNVGGQTGSDRVWTNWWNARRNVCLTVVTMNGRYDSIVSGPVQDCQAGRPSTLPGPVGGPVGPERPTTLPGPVGGPVSSGRTETIRFDRGASSATRRSAITGYETATYLIDIRAGQRLTVDFQPSNRSASFNITAPGASEALFNGSINGNRYAGRVPATGTYRIEVYLARNAARRGENARFSLGVGATR